LAQQKYYELTPANNRSSSKIILGCKASQGYKHYANMSECCYTYNAYLVYLEIEINSKEEINDELNRGTQKSSKLYYIVKEILQTK
jgi:hypothetical protein